MNERQRGRQLAVWLCAVLFIIFGLFYLGLFQSRLLETAQWILSHHQTHYMPLASPLTIVGVLVLLAVAISRFVKLQPAMHAMAYAPSFWSMALLTNIALPMPDATSNGWGWLGFTICAILILLLLWSLPHIFLQGNTSHRTSSATIVLGNLSIMAILMFGTALASNTHIHLHITAEMSKLAKEKRYSDLLKTGARSPHCSRSICAMRAYAMSKEGVLPEKLFSFPQHHGATALIPPKADSLYSFDWPNEFYSHLGSVCREDVTQGSEAISYFKQVAQRHPGRIQADYLLCAYLLERRLDDFARELPLHYAINDSLPRHYKEALIVYQRRSQAPILQYHDEETEANMAGFLKLKARFSDSQVQEFNLVDMYPETYWCYYYFPSREDK